MIAPASTLSSRTLARVSKRDRMLSSADSVLKANRIANVRNSRVVPPAVGSTRSYTWSMYSIGAMNSRFSSALNAKA